MKGEVLKARRGSLLGNLTSWKSAALKTVVTVTLKEVADGATTVECRMRISSAFQVLVEWDSAFWSLEMDTFESLLARGDAKEAEWARFTHAYTKSITKRLLTLGVVGNKLIDEFRATSDSSRLLRASGQQDGHTAMLLRPNSQSSAFESDELLRASSDCSPGNAEEESRASLVSEDNSWQVHDGRPHML